MSDGLRKVIDTSLHTDVAGLNGVVNGNGRHITRAANSLVFMPFLGIAVPEGILTWHHVVTHGKSSAESIKKFGSRLYNGANRLSVQFDRYVLGVDYSDVPEINLGILDWIRDTAHKPFEYALQSAATLPSRVRKTYDTLASTVKEAQYFNFYRIDISQIEERAIPEKVWDLMHAFALTRPTLKNGYSVTLNPTSEMMRMNTAFQDFTIAMRAYQKEMGEMREKQGQNGASEAFWPTPAILAGDLKVYVEGYPVAQLHPATSTATKLNGYKNPTFWEELGFAGYKVVDKAK